MIHANHAATSWPKPPEVIEAVSRSLAAAPIEGERAGVASASDSRRQCREVLSALFHAPDPSAVILTAGATAGLNMVIDGLLRDGGHAVTTATEHNSAVRPLHRLSRERGVRVTVVGCDRDGRVDPVDVIGAIEADTKAVIINHASNVTGRVIDPAPIGRACRSVGVSLVVDAAQSAGHIPIDVQAMGIDALVFAGHKGLLGPCGTGGVVLSPELELRPLMVGGTGVRSESLEQPTDRPMLYEAGTPNLAGIAGLEAGVRHCLRMGVRRMGTHLVSLMDRLWDGLSALDGVRLIGGRPAGRVAVQSFLIEGMAPADVGYVLQESYGVTCRAGLHCAPLIHDYLGSSNGGTVRLSLGLSNTPDEVDSMVAAVAEIASASRAGAASCRS